MNVRKRGCIRTTPFYLFCKGILKANSIKKKPSQSLFFETAFSY